MSEQGNMNASLIAPCGMYCGICSAYLAFLNGIPKKHGKIFHCAGCRARNKQCAYLKGQCSLLAKNKVTYCFECATFPCERLRKISGRYETRYQTRLSFVENLKMIKAKGEKALLNDIRKRFSCEKCGGLRSIHNNKCFGCDDVKSWKE